MSGLVRQAFVVTFSRFANQALAFISPVILVRLLTVEEFGTYRQFLLYFTILTPCAGLAINNSLLYFVGAGPDKVNALVRQTTFMVFASSLTCVLLVLIADEVTHNGILDSLHWPVLLCVLLNVNIDFWEFLWLAQKKVAQVFAYSTGRLVVRMMVVLVVATVIHDVDAIIWAVVAVEAARFIVAAIAWVRLFHGSQPLDAQFGWRKQAKFCAPVAFGTVVGTLSRYAGELFVVSMLSSVALAQYAIGAYVQYVVAIVRNSISDVLLPVMAGESLQGRSGTVKIWKDATIVFAMLLLPVAVLLAHFAKPIILLLFSDKYLPAVALFQLYVLILVRECFDFDLVIRALNKTEVLIRSNLICIVSNIVCLFVLVPRIGIAGAVISMLISRTLEAIYLGYCVTKVLDVSLRWLLPFVELVQVCFAIGLASCVLLFDWESVYGFFGITLGAGSFLLIYMAVLYLLKVHALESAIYLLRGRAALLGQSQ